MSNKVPILHIYQREAEPCDEFDAGGMHVTTPLKMKRPIYWHKTPADRAEAAQDTKITLQDSKKGTGWLGISGRSMQTIIY